MNRIKNNSPDEIKLTESEKITLENNRLKSLRDDAAKYRFFIENLPVLFYAAEPFPPYAPIYVSQAFEQFGYPLEEWRGDADLWTRTLHPEDREWVLRKTEAAMRAGKETDFEYRIIAKNGDVQWVRDRGSFIRDEKGEIICWQGVIINVADRRKAEDALRESESRYRQMFLKNQAVKLLIDAESGEIIEVNPAACEFYGYTAEEFKGRNIREINVLPPAEIFREMMLARSENRNYFNFQHRLASGELRDVEVHSSPLNIENKKLLFSIVHDVTERCRAERKLKRREELYRTLAHNIPQTAVVLFDREFRYTLADGELLEKQGFSRQMFEGRTLWEVFPKETHTKWESLYKRALKGETVRVDWENEHGYYQIDVLPIKNERGEISSGMVIWQDVSAHKSVENALRESEKRYRDLSEKSLGMICTHDLDGKLLSINAAAADVMGYAPEEVIGKPLEAFVPANAVEYCRLYLEEVKKKGAFFGSFPILTKAGEERIIKFSNILYQESGKPPFVLGSAQDITKLKRTEQELRALFEAMTDVILVLDKNGRYLKIAPNNPSLLCRSVEELTGKTLAEVFPAAQAQIILEAIQSALATNQTQRLEYMMPVRGRDICFAANISPMTADSVIFVARDITERKKSEEALKESEARYRDLFENAKDLIYIHDLEGNFLDANKAAERVFGYSREEALKINIGQIIAPEDLIRAQQMLTEKIAGAERQTAYELECIAKDGHRLSLEVSTSLIYENGKAVAVQGIARDVTERRRTEQALREREEQYRDLFENANDLIYTHDLQGNFTSLNRAGEIITGYTREEALKTNIEAVVAPEYLEAARAMIVDKLAGESSTVYELEIVSKQGNRVSLELSTRIIYQNGKPVGIQGIGRDITERKRSEEALVNSERRYRSLGEGIMHQVWTAQPDGTLDYTNKRTIEYFGTTPERLLSGGWKDFIHPEDLPESLKRWKQSLETGNNYKVEFRLKKHDGEYRWHQARATAGRDANGKIINWFGTNTDINDQKIAEDKLSHFAGHDTLTDLPNRAKFMNHLRRAVSRSEHYPQFRFAVLFLDLDRFKIINDSLGHVVGDQLLVAISKRLLECVRPQDTVARLGGDEFTVLLSNVSGVGDAVAVANRFLEKLAAPFNLGNYEVFTSASIGIILSGDVQRQPEDYLRDADTAMYRAKEAGKSRYEVFDREMHIRNINLLEMETDLRRAIAHNEFRVFYQPIVKLETGEIREFEALIRWQHPKYGMIPPNDFVGIAEETGLIIPIGDWILNEACRQTARWQKIVSPKNPLSISVNLSAKQLMHPRLREQVAEALIQTELDPRCLKLEVTESMVMENSDKALAVISELNKLGISLSTDDFGTGYSSLSYLHKFPFDRLKIDRSFVSKMDADEKSEAIVRTILLLGQNLNIEVVAEGIETETQLESLIKLGCKTGQGYLFSKPVDSQTAERLLLDGLSDNFNRAAFTSREGQMLELDKVQ